MKEEYGRILRIPTHKTRSDGPETDTWDGDAMWPQQRPAVETCSDRGGKNGTAAPESTARQERTLLWLAPNRSGDSEASTNGSMGVRRSQTACVADPRAIGKVETLQAGMEVMDELWARTH